MELSEALFFYDSTYCIKVLNVIAGEKETALRWQTALFSIDALLSFGSKMGIYLYGSR